MDFLTKVTNTVGSILPGNNKNKNVIVAAAENSNGDMAVVATNAPANSQAGGKRRRGNMRKTSRRTNMMRRNTRRTNMRRTNTRRTNMRRANTRRTNMRRANTRRTNH